MIRRATLSDCNNLAALSIQVWLSAYARDGINAAISDYVLATFNQQHFVTLLAQDDYQIYVATENDLLLGFIAVNLCSDFKSSEHGFEIDTLYVQGRQQGRGIGRRLLQYIATEHQAKYWLSTWSHNVEAIDFYRRFGFKDIGQSYFELDGAQHENTVLAFNPDSANTA